MGKDNNKKTKKTIKESDSSSTSESTSSSSVSEKRKPTTTKKTVDVGGLMEEIRQLKKNEELYIKALKEGSKKNLAKKTTSESGKFGMTQSQKNMNISELPNTEEIIKRDQDDETEKKKQMPRKAFIFMTIAIAAFICIVIIIVALFVYEKKTGKITAFFRGAKTKNVVPMTKKNPNQVNPPSNDGKVSVVYE